MKAESTPSRRRFLKDLGYISIGFSLFSSCLRTEDQIIAERIPYNGDLPGSLKREININAWIKILENGRVQVLSGKVELGQGIRTAIRQVAAEELDMNIENVDVLLAETGVTPNEGYTGASASIQNSAMSVRYAAATARIELLELASKKLGVTIEELQLYNGRVTQKGTNKVLTYSDILEGVQFEKEVAIPIQLKKKTDYRYVGKAIPRTDIEKMVKGEVTYIHDLRFPEMVHARVIRPAGYDSKLLQIDTSGLKEAVSGVLKTVVNGSFVAVITEREYQAVKAERFLKNNTKWSSATPLPESENQFEHIKKIANPPENIRNDGDFDNVTKSVKTIKSRYNKPYIMHGSMGPACGIAMYDGEILHIWSHSQGIYPLRDAIASMLNMEVEKIHIKSAPGAGCYGHSTADDAATDAALLAFEYPKKHIRVQWSRNDDQKWDPYGPAIITEFEASLDEKGKINSWKSDVWTDSHSTRPNKDTGTILAARYLEKPFHMKSRGYLAGGHRNADPYYNIPNMQLNAHYYEGPLRVSSLRSLGSFANIFAVESFMDELAEKAGKDPLNFRLEHTDDQRAIAVITKIQTLTESQTTIENEGIGYGFMRYKNTDAYAAVAAKVAINSDNGVVSVIKLWAAIDVGEVINLDGIINQIEGGMIQATSWTLKEQVTFNASEITSTDWNTYPILRYSEIPEVEVAIIDRPNEPVYGAGEVPMPPTSAAIANAVFKASGKRVYDLPIKTLTQNQN
ncbi:xanthine dehydrogenase family protein molybdopterin-binding subunit [Aurantibacter crassamenti]|uniref:xanthine dehydrogenase family protein molybdopterin-binding subunit n=1 Tax=Aurantibacter crassamenti TaxID=1837375 RepID=UPI0019397E67|nr:molybdopterin cofactor-binding domain-containing protein [Aurantibacter crassamenti]MBM1107289.1 xanthine dehydrogenase family protein molybdopterin-binding subunit [Aurantibacter crassamenti]